MNVYMLLLGNMCLLALGASPLGDVINPADAMGIGLMFMAAAVTADRM